MEDNQPTASQITTIYRQQASNFLCRSDALLNNHDGALTSWVGDAARSLALRAAAPTDDVRQDNTIEHKKAAKAAKRLNAKGGKVSAEDIIETLPPNWSDFICAACGTFLFPPIDPTCENDCSSVPSAIQSSQMLLPSNIYLRSMKRGRTRRRRASRAKAKELHDRSLSLQRRGASNTNVELRKDALAKEETQRIASSYRTGDGRSRQCLVLKCTHCGTKKRRKGIDVKGDRRGDANSDRSAQKKKGAKQPDTRAEKKTITAQIRDNTDYISLASLGGVGKKSGKPQPHSKGQIHTGERKKDEPDAFASPLLGGKKKKKKKKPEPKKGGLMDFLSSLND